MQSSCFHTLGFCCRCKYSNPSSNITSDTTQGTQHNSRHTYKPGASVLNTDPHGWWKLTTDAHKMTTQCVSLCGWVGGCVRVCLGECVRVREREPGTHAWSTGQKLIRVTGLQDKKMWDDDTGSEGRQRTHSKAWWEVWCRRRPADERGEPRPTRTRCSDRNVHRLFRPHKPPPLKQTALFEQCCF